jgi:hypothetical protein
VVFESAEWEPLIAGARLAEGIIEENEHLLHLAGTVPWGSRK